MNTAHSSEPVKRVLDRLEEMGKQIRWVNNQHMAQCPAHPDRNPSLCIREGAEGALLDCKAGCQTVDVLAAMGLEMKDLFPPRPAAVASNVVPLHPAPGPSLQWVRDYVYRDSSGEPAFKVTRYARVDEHGQVIGKSFRQYRAGARGTWLPGLNGSAPPLYRLPEVLAAVEAGRIVLVVEGEKDADTIAELGTDVVATTSPMGAGKWREEHTAALAGANVIIIADDDDPGKAHALAVYEALDGVALAVQLALPAEGFKDVSEQLEAGLGLDKVRRCAPQDFGGQYVATLPIGEPVRHLVVRPASELRLARVRWGWADRMPIGELTLIPGREGVGKSLFLAWLAAQLTRGTLPGEFRGEPRSVLYMAAEDSWRYTIGPRMVAAGADLDLIYRVEAVDGDPAIWLPADCDLIAEVAIETRAAALMLDPIVSLIDDRLSVNQPRELRRALEPLRRAAEKAEIMVPALAHFNKTVDADVLSKIPGARAWAEVARAAFGLAKDDEAECYVASQIKSNLGRLDLPHLSYRIENVYIDVEDGQADVGRLVWTGETDVGVEEVLGRKPERRARETSETTNAIVAFVVQSDGLVPLADIYHQFPLVQQPTIRQALKRAVDRGTLSNPYTGLYGRGDT